MTDYNEYTNCSYCSDLVLTSDAITDPTYRDESFCTEEHFRDYDEVQIRLNEYNDDQHERFGSLGYFLTADDYEVYA